MAVADVYRDVQTPALGSLVRWCVTVGKRRRDGRENAHLNRLNARLALFVLSPSLLPVAIVLPTVPCVSDARPVVFLINCLCLLFLLCLFCFRRQQSTLRPTRQSHRSTAPSDPTNLLLSLSPKKQTINTSVKMKYSFAFVAGASLVAAQLPSR